MIDTIPMSFGGLYTLFIGLIERVSDIWSILNMKVSQIPEINLDGEGLAVLFDALVNSTIKSLQVVAEHFFGDVTLLEFVLGASLVTVVGCYIVKFVLSFTPLL